MSMSETPIHIAKIYVSHKNKPAFTMGWTGWGGGLKGTLQY